MKRTSALSLFSLAALLFAACGGGEADPRTEDESNVVSVVSVSSAGATEVAERACRAPVVARGEAGEPQAAPIAEQVEAEPCAANFGYCCDTTDGHVSKTQMSGCQATGEVWVANYAACLMTLCGPHCTI